ncbi:hypothetical protein [Micromonospora sp. NPDC004551]|uniref:hypothetical protein n=1 Tax=Micromonospora sp. NPDC004551 TaxID=3154284 RepID=UPI0033A1D872
MSFITFSLDQFNLPVFRVDDKRYETLGAWLIADVSRHFLVCLDGLAMIDDVSNGRPPFEEWSSENYEVSFASSGVVIQNSWLEHEHGAYTVDEVRRALEDYWSFLVALPERPLIREFRPDLPESQAALLRWEEKWGRPHPYRGRLL